MTERETVKAAGKEYPLKTEAERAASRPRPASKPAPLREVEASAPSRSVSVSGAPRQVLLALTLSLVIFLAAGGRIEKDNE